VHLLAKACYDPDANITMLQKLEKAQQQQGVETPPELLSTHPLTQVTTSLVLL
jgi:predicted Zn-dependent protease